MNGNCRTDKEVRMNGLIVLPVTGAILNRKFQNAYETFEDYAVNFDGKEIRVPKYFQYDGTSLSLIVRLLIGTPFNPRSTRAVLIHDWIHFTHQLSKQDADDLFCRLLREDGLDEVRVQLVRWGMKFCGGYHWENDECDFEYTEKLRYKIVACGGDASLYGL